MSIEAQLDEYVKRKGYTLCLYVRPEVDPVTRCEVEGSTVYVATLRKGEDAFSLGASSEDYGDAIKNAALKLK